VGKSLYGIFNSLSKISGSIGKVVATLSEDRGYIKERQKRCESNMTTVFMELVSNLESI